MVSGSMGAQRPYGWVGPGFRFCVWLDIGSPDFHPFLCGLAPSPWPFLGPSILFNLHVPSFLLSPSLRLSSCHLTTALPIPLLQGIVGNLSSGKSALVHRYLTGTYVQEESPEGEHHRLGWP